MLHSGVFAGEAGSGWPFPGSARSSLGAGGGHRSGAPGDGGGRLCRIAGVRLGVVSVHVEYRRWVFFLSTHKIQFAPYHCKELKNLNDSDYRVYCAQTQSDFKFKSYINNIGRNTVLKHMIHSEINLLQ